MVFEVAQDLLTAASQNHRLALYKAKAGWVLLGALMTLGKLVDKDCAQNPVAGGRRRCFGNPLALFLEERGHCGVCLIPVAGPGIFVP